MFKRHEITNVENAQLQWRNATPFSLWFNGQPPILPVCFVERDTAYWILAQILTALFKNSIRKTILLHWSFGFWVRNWNLFSNIIHECIYNFWLHYFFFKKIEIQCLVCGKLELWNVKSKELPHHFVRKVLSVPLFGVLTDNSINVINFLSLISQNTGYFPCLPFGVWVRNWNLFSNMLFMSACTINFWLYYFFC